jgi:hypothetical protein
MPNCEDSIVFGIDLLIGDGWVCFSCIVIVNGCFHLVPQLITHRPITALSLCLHSMPRENMTNISYDIF